MNLSSAIEALIEAGATPAMILALVRRHEAEQARSAAERRSKDAERQRSHRAAKASEMSRDVTVTSRDSRGPSPHVGERALVVTPSLPSLRSEEVKPVSPDGDTTPLAAKAPKSNGFAEFWAAYPNKVGKAAAAKAYAKALRDIHGPDPPSVILAGVERAKASRSWVGGYIPHPTTWLRRGSWDDEPAEIIPINGTPHERPHHDPKFDARQANLARAFAGAESAAGRAWKP